MPYTKSNLPAYVKRKSESDQERWLSIWNDVFRETGSETDAFKAANGALSLKVFGPTFGGVPSPQWLSLRAEANDRRYMIAEFFVSSVFPDWDASGVYRVQYVRTGLWREHAQYGDIVITAADLAEAMRNYRNASRKPFLDDDHGITNPELSNNPGVAFGWMRDFWVEDLNGKRYDTADEIESATERVLIAFAEFEVNEQANEWIKNKQKPLFSPTFYPWYQNKETGKLQGMTILGGAMTAIPYFDGMEHFVTVAASGLSVARTLTEMYPMASMQLAVPNGMSMSDAVERLRKLGYEVRQIEYWTVWVSATEGGNLSDKLGELEAAGFSVSCFYQGVMQYHGVNNRGQHNAGGNARRTDATPQSMKHVNGTKEGNKMDFDFGAHGLRLFKQEGMDATRFMAAVELAVRSANTNSEDNAKLRKDAETFTAQINTMSAELKTFRDKEAAAIAAARESIVQGAVDDFKIRRTDKDKWLKRYDDNPSGTTEILGEMAPHSEFRDEIGHGGSAGPGNDINGTSMSATMREIESLADRVLKDNPEMKGDRIAARKVVFSAREDLYNAYRAETTRGSSNGNGSKGGDR